MKGTEKVNRCPTCKRPLKRSNDANRRYWALLHVMAEKIVVGGERYSADSWHRYCGSRFLGCDDVLLPNKKVMTIVRSTASLDKGEFSNYMSAVESFANEHGAFLEDEGW